MAVTAGIAAAVASADSAIVMVAGMTLTAAVIAAIGTGGTVETAVTVGTTEISRTAETIVIRVTVATSEAKPVMIGSKHLIARPEVETAQLKPRRRTTVLPT